MYVVQRCSKWKERNRTNKNDTFEQLDAATFPFQNAGVCDLHMCVCARSADVPQPELMLTTTRGRATVAGLDSTQEYNLQVLLLNGTTEKLLAKRRFTSKRRTGGDGGGRRVTWPSCLVKVPPMSVSVSEKKCPSSGRGFNLSFYLQKISNLSKS